ncbi:MAG: LacI family DNA-binding transcriptional regulator [Flavonifractor plautii]
MRAPTISEVAKTAGVSVATVSRVVNGSPSVSHETQARVQEAIERLGYQPNVWGRSLRRGESRVVLVIVPNVSNPYYAPIIAGTEDRLHEDGYSGMLCITNAEAGRRALYLEFLKDGRADGAILMEPARDDPHVTGMARHYHLVQCSEYCDNQAVSHVSVDNLAAAREVVLTLAGLGHRRIGFIGADNDFMSTIARRQGYLDGLRVLNIPAGGRPDLCRTGLQLSSGVEAARRLLARPERPRPCSASPTCWPWAPCRPPGAGPPGAGGLVGGGV